MSRDRGQATVELALVMPFLCLLMLGTVQVAVLARDRLAVQLAAREAARAASVAEAGRGAAGAATAAVRLQPLRIGIEESGGMVHATVSYTDPTDIPLIGALLPSVEVRATVSMAVEPP